ncbi:glycoside hydrolase family 47 protein [Babjeviella inositovora NRRL Y-12698]|uniref:alpha-1,2-Mannosidase n=1 Tax=Babjeviella inositovora NRRL Y-12698 TaxID=984486 RepID=A0A1E3QZC6_9ASCO|nr:glycoside hydrolase family 47 protein [Babjeviella inositovora NRRL Y-12698]ODQ83033.1 glycoside hydrolase family 47 protein [Babjeviella inositovora NRRL Y-12698]
MLLKGFLLSIVLYIVYLLGVGFNQGEGHLNISWKEAQNEVKQAFVDSWHSYEKNAWGADIYHPITQTGENMGPKPLGWMIVDSLDTMMMMGLTDETARARKWIKKELTYDFDYDVNVFETTIRMLGGLLSGFYLSKDDVYLDKATDLANRLLGGFNTPSGLPYASVNLKTGKGIKNHVDSGASSTAEVATLQLEFKYLAKLTGEKMYWDKVEKIMEVLERNQPEAGLVPIYVNPDTGKFKGNLIRLGSRGDSYYEYLLKQFLQTNRQEPVYYDMYLEAVQGIKKHLTRKSQPNGLTFIGELERGIGGELSPKMDHLVCFIGGLLALGATEGLPYNDVRKSGWWSSSRESELHFARDITHTCYKMYQDVSSGLSPEIVVFNTDAKSKEDFYIKPLDRHNLQRPETVESLFVLYRITKDPIYRRWGWEIFQSFKKHSQYIHEDGEVTYTSLKDVTTDPPVKKDEMESFWLAETLKYLYLLFDDEDTMPLDKVVFNTEAHPFPKFDLGTLFETGWTAAAPVEVNPEAGQPLPRKALDTPIKAIPKAAEPAKPIDQVAREAALDNPEILMGPRDDAKMKELEGDLEDLAKHDA